MRPQSDIVAQLGGTRPEPTAAQPPTEYVIVPQPLRPDVEPYTRDIADPSRSIKDRTDTIEAVAKLARGDDGFAYALRNIGLDTSLPIVVRASALHRMAPTDLWGALACLDRLNGQKNYPMHLDAYVVLFSRLTDGTAYAGDRAKGWSIPGDILRRSPVEVWGLAMAMILTELRLPIGDRIRAATELAGAGDTERALAMLRGYPLHESVDEKEKVLCDAEYERIQRDLG